MEISMGAVVNLVKKVTGAATGKTPPAPPAEEEVEEEVSPITEAPSGPSIFPKPGDVLTQSEGGLPKFDKPGGSTPLTDAQIEENKKKGGGFGDQSRPDDYTLDTTTEPEPEPITPKEVVRQGDAGSVATGQYKKKRRTKTKTVMTSSAGVLGAAPVQRKTLLGS
jgi:hypothetical protein